MKTKDKDGFAKMALLEKEFGELKESQEKNFKRLEDNFPSESSLYAGDYDTKVEHVLNKLLEQVRRWRCTI